MRALKDSGRLGLENYVSHLQWERHFLTHVEGSHPQHPHSEDDLPEEAAAEDTAIIEDPDRPWIQRVEYIIQKWGVSQYVRLAFVCRICHKEQQVCFWYP